MVRYEIQQDDNITIAYGYDQLNGLFLSVYDKRVRWDKTNTNEMNEICNKYVLLVMDLI